jgi:hypothetical protein
MLYACRLQMNRKRIAKLNGNTTMPGSDNHLQLHNQSRKDAFIANK